jgi:hypothetical protein
LVFRVFMVTIFPIIFNSIFGSLLFVPLPNIQNELRMKSKMSTKMAQKCLPWTTLMTVAITVCLNRRCQHNLRSSKQLCSCTCRIVIISIQNGQSIIIV